MSTLLVSEVGPQLARALAAAQTTRDVVEVAQDGQRVAVVLNAQQYDSLVETLEVLADAETVTAIQQGLADLTAGRVCSTEDLAQELRRRGRL